MKRTIVIFIVFFGFVSHAYALTGDVYPIGSSDGKVTIDDAVAALRMVAGLVTPDVKADVSPLGHPDGQVNVGDALILARTALNSMVIYAPVTAGTTGKEGQTVAFSTASLLSQFGSAGSNGLSKVIVTSLPANGTLKLGGNPVAVSQVIDSANLGNLIFTPTSYWNGSTSFTYNASDGKSYTTSGVTANITLAAVNDPPTASNFSRTGDEDTIIAFTSNDFIGKFSDVDGNILSKIKITSLPVNGTLKLSGNSVTLDQEIDAAGLGNLTFTPDSNWNGNTSFTYNGSDGTIYAMSGAIVNITVTAINDSPTVDSVSRTGVEDTIIAFTNADFTSEFSDVDGNNLSKIKVTSFMANGILKLSGNAVIVGQEIDFVDISSLTFTPNFNWNGTTSFNYNANDGITYAVSGATVNITVTAANDAPIAASGTLTTNEDTVGSGTLTASDIDNNALTYSIVANGSKGTATVVNASTGAYLYTPNANANGADTFTFKVNDSVSDSNTANVTVAITPVNDVPVALGGTLTAHKDASATGTLPASDADGDTLTYSIVVNGSKGTAAINESTGAYSYTPNFNFVGSDSIVFMVKDKASGSDSDTVIITVTNQAPTAASGTLTTNEDTVGTGTLTASDADGNNLTYSIVANGAKGVASIDAITGTYSYTPNADAYGVDTFTLKVNDGVLDSNTATVTVTIASVNDNPVANAGNTQTVNENATVTLSGSGTDVEDPIVGYAWSQVSGTAVSLANANTASASFTAPLLAAQEELKFLLTVTDNEGLTGSADVKVNVNLVPRTVSIANATITEGDSGTSNMVFTLSINLAAKQTITVNHATDDNSGSAVVGSDYTKTSGTVIFNIDDTTKTITVPIVGDVIDEANETFNVALSNPVNVTINNGTGVGTINDNDPEPTVAFTSTSQSINEGSQATVTLQLSAVSGMNITVPFTVTGTATAGDYSILTANPVTIAKGSSSATVTFIANSDAVADGGETVVLILGLPTYATPGTIPTHTVTINNMVLTLILPKTGQTTSYAAGDDGALKVGVAWPTQRFTDNNNGTITDNLTGLIWLKAINCIVFKNWSAALTSANTLASGYCGLTDGSVAGSWRLPNYKELDSLVDIGQTTLFLPTGHPFSELPEVPMYWSSSTIAYDTSSAWIVDGSISAGLKDIFDMVSVLPVFGNAAGGGLAQVPETGQTLSYGTGDDGATQNGLALPNPRFSDLGDGTVIDNLTSLIWMKKANCWGSMDWNSALMKVADLNSGTASCSGYTGGQNDWRLPNRKELMSLIDSSNSFPALSTGNPFFGVQSNIYWSSSTVASATSSAWFVGLGGGNVYYDGKSGSGYVWPVRGGQ